MAAAARRLGKLLGALLAGIVLAVIAFALAGWIGSSIPRNAGWREPADGIEILVGSNGVHTELVLPVVSAEKDWRTDFPATDLADPGEGYTHVAIGWGEKQVFLNTPTWWDLSPLTVLRIVGIGGDGVLHVSHYVRPAPSDDFRPLLLTHAEYARLVAAIGQSVPPQPRVRYPGYGTTDVFYDAPGHYTARNTCNQWTGNMLAAAGVKIGRWTPFAGGVMKWIPKPGA